MNNVKFGENYEVIEGAFTGQKGVLCGGFGKGCYFIRESNGDRIMVTASQIKIISDDTNNQVIKPPAYEHLSDYQYALQQVLNALSIFISVDGRELNVENYMPLSICQILSIEKLYNTENAINNGNTPYLINIKSEAFKGVAENDLTLSKIIC